MDLELLDQLEEKVEVAVSTVGDLRKENDLLKEEIVGLEEKMEGLNGSLKETGRTAAEAGELRERCEELERKLTGVKGRIQTLITKMKALED